LRKVIVILFVGIIAGGCSLSKKAFNGTPTLSTDNILENVLSQNLTSSGFFIRKAEVEINTKNVKQKFLATVKFFSDRYLISLKSRTGIEGARIYISKDSLIVNDRINKKMYFGTSGYLIEKFGMNQSLLPLVFGDIVIENSNQDSKKNCFEGRLKFSCVLKGVDLNYNIDCKKSKNTLVTLSNNYLRQSVNIRSEGYVKTGNILVPRVVLVEDLNTSTTIRIRFMKIEHPWNGNLKFVPGRGYELIELL
jgi:hypothetical protein